VQGIVAHEDLPPTIAGYLAAAATTHDWREAESLLLRAQQSSPECLHVYYTLYKLYAVRNRLSDAERAVHMALDASARQAHISSHWQSLTPHSCDWSQIDSPQHFYLFSLKAFAYIRLRQQRLPEVRQILTKLQEIDPQDTVGASVIQAYADGVPL
jgi:hypothetical protein